MEKKVWVTIASAVILAVGGVLAHNWTQLVGPGGAIAHDPPPMACSAHPSEDYQAYASCPAGTESFLEWCSGDCNDDDARVRICCTW